MDWFDRLMTNRYVDVVLLANNQGRMMRSSTSLRSDDELLASMLQAIEVLAQTLSVEFGCGAAEMVQISTDRGHLLLFPLMRSTYYLTVMVQRNAPLILLMVELERTLKDLSAKDFEMYAAAPSEETTELNAAELIEAVQEWLRQRPLDLS